MAQRQYNPRPAILIGPNNSKPFKGNSLFLEK